MFNSRVKIFLDVIFDFCIWIFLTSVVGHFVFFTIGRSVAAVEFVFYFLFTVASLILLYKPQRNVLDYKSFYKTKDFGIAISLFIFALLVKIYFNSSLPFWGDEISQFYRAKQLGPIMGAAFQQQVPIGYFLTFWAEKLFGYGELALRIPVIFISSIGLAFFYLLLRFFNISFSASLGALLIFFFNPTVFQYGLEARPVAIAMTTVLLFFYEFVRFTEHCSFSRAIKISRIAAITFIFINTIGFQPEIFLIVLCIFLVFAIPYFNDAKDNLIGINLGLFCALPILINVIIQSLQYVSIKEKLFETSRYFGFFLFDQFPMMILVLIFGVFTFYRKRLQSSDHFKLRCSLSLMGLSVSFYGTAVLLFHLFINYKMMTRYLLVGCMPFFAGCAFFSDELMTAIAKKSRLGHLAISGLLFLFLGGYALYFYPRTYKNPDWFRSDRNNAMGFLNDHVKPNDGVLMTCTGVPNCFWDHNYIIFHFNQLNVEVKQNVERPTYSFAKNLISNKDVDQIYILIKGPKLMNLFSEADLVWKEADSVIYRLSQEKKWDQLQFLIDLLKNRSIQDEKFPKNNIQLFEFMIRLRNGEKLTDSSRPLFVKPTREEADFVSALYDN